MTTREFIEWVGRFPIWVPISVFVAIPVIAKLLVYAHGPGKGNTAPWKFIYAALVYCACLPGVLAAVVAAYTLFFTNDNFLDQNVLLYIFPIISMVVTLVWIRQNVNFDDVPGFDRLSGLIAVVSVTFILVLAIHKTRIWLVFGGSIFVLAGAVLALIALLQWGLHALLRKSADRGD